MHGSFFLSRIIISLLLITGYPTSPSHYALAQYYDSWYYTIAENAIKSSFFTLITVIHSHTSTKKSSKHYKIIVPRSTQSYPKLISYCCSTVSTWVCTLEKSKGSPVTLSNISTTSSQVVSKCVVAS